MFDKIKVSQNNSLVGKFIDFETFIQEFGYNKHNRIDLYEQARHDVNEYADALNEHVKGVIENIFESYTFNVDKLRYNKNIVAYSKGAVYVVLMSDININGTNPYLPKK